MAQLREVLAGAGFANVRTYIQSGNALVDTELTAVEVERKIHALILQHIGADLAVVARTNAELQRAVESNPFQKGLDSSRVFFVLFAEPPADDKMQQLLAQDYGDEKLAIFDHVAVMYIPGTYGRGKLSGMFLEKKLGIPVTMRNFNTMHKLLELSKD